MAGRRRIQDNDLVAGGIDGARKGLADTALRTADSGYLTRRLIDVAQEVIVLEEDCGTDKGVVLHAEASEEDIMIAPIEERILGRVASEAVVNPQTGEIIVDENQMIEPEDAIAITDAGINPSFARCLDQIGARVDTDDARTAVY